MTSRPTLHVGNKNYSSWSLRPWLVLRWAGIAFDEHLIPLGGEGYGKSAIPGVVAVSPSGRVPALTLGDRLTLWDSLAITEWAAERGPVWPADPTRRALARCASAEMHSSFSALRRDLGMNIRRRTPDITAHLPGDTLADLARLRDLVADLHARFGGPWLLGERSAADAFYAPVATRLRTYGIPLSRPLARWSEVLLADGDFRAWEADAIAEPQTIDDAEALWR